MKFHFYRQYDAMDCGPACLRMIAKFYGKSETMEDIRNACEINKEGVNLLGISNAAEKMGFETRSIKLSIDEIIDCPLPLILFWNQNHFVVLHKIQHSMYHIADPAVGKLILSTSDFEKYWSENSLAGIALILRPGAEFNLQKSLFSKNKFNDAKGEKKILNYLYGHYRSIILALGLLGITGLIQFVLPYITKNIVDKGIEGKDFGLLKLMLLAQFALLVGRLLVEFIRSRILLKIGNRVTIAILTDFIHKLMKLPLTFFDAHKKGSLIQRMQDHGKIESFLTGSILSALFAIINLIVFSIILMTYNFTIFTIFIGSSICYSGWVYLFMNKRKKLDYERFDIQSREQNTALQLLEGMPEIKLFGMENTMKERWKLLQILLFNNNLKIFSVNQLQQSGSIVINETKNIVIIFIAANLVITGEISLGTMLAIQMIIGQINSPIEQFLFFFQNRQVAKIAMLRLNEIHKMQEEEDLKENYLQTVFEQDYILSDRELHSSNILTLRNVTYTYPGAGNLPVLTDIFFEIPKGKTTAIVGMSGSGKTTILKLLLKYFQPQEGEIFFGNTLFNQISHKAWRSLCGVVMQESYIFNDTIGNNIALGDAKPEQMQLEKAAKIAKIFDYIEQLPLGFNTKIGMEGYGLSTGQRQRILIARAIYKNPEYIFLDEATNSLDAKNEKDIQDNLQEFFIGKTVVIVAHRLSTVKLADQIIVLNKGKIVEVGNHLELLSKRGEYYELVQNQMT